MNGVNDDIQALGSGISAGFTIRIDADGRPIDVWCLIITFRVLLLVMRESKEKIVI